MKTLSGQSDRVNIRKKHIKIKANPLSLGAATSSLEESKGEVHDDKEVLHLGHEKRLSTVEEYRDTTTRPDYFASASRDAKPKDFGSPRSLYMNV